MKRIRILLADDHPLIRAGIRSILDAIPGVEIIAEASDGHEALALVEQHHPHMVLTDIAMPGLNGIELAARITQAHPQIRVVILSMHASEQYVHRALRSGARGYVLKEASSEELGFAVDAVARGETYLSPAVSHYVVSGYVGGGGVGEQNSLARLTSRQREILQLIVEGHKSKEIAKKLKLSTRTVESHRAQLMTQLGIRDVAGLVRYAISVGLIHPND